MQVAIDDIKQAITPIAAQLGYEIVDVDYKKSGDGDNLTVYIWRKGGISLDDCENFHKSIDAVLDELDPTSGGAYVLNISSPGLDRPIVTADDFRRNLDEQIELLYVIPRGKKTKTHGILVSYNDTEIIIDQNDKQAVIKRSDISAVRPYIKF